MTGAMVLGTFFPGAMAGALRPAVSSMGFVTGV